MNSAIGAVNKAGGYYFRISDPGKNGLQSTDDLSLKSKYEFVLGDASNNFLYISILDDEKEKSVEMWSLEVDPSQKASGNVEVTIIADTRHIQRSSERKIVPTLRDDFLCNSPTTPKHPRPWTHERIPGISRNVSETYEFADVLGTIAEGLHLTRCDQVCFTRTGDDQAEQHFHGTINEVLGDPYMEQRRCSGRGPPRS